MSLEAISSFVLVVLTFILFSCIIVYLRAKYVLYRLEYKYKYIKRSNGIEIIINPPQ
jgi:hypothetical protein